MVIKLRQKAPAVFRFITLLALVGLVSGLFLPSNSTIRASQVGPPGDFTTYTVSPNIVKPGDSNVVVMDFMLPVTKNGEISIIDEIVHFVDRGEEGPPLATGDQLLRFPSDYYWADVNLDDKYTGNVSQILVDYLGNYSQESIITEGGGNQYATQDNVTNLEHSDSVHLPGQFGIIGLNLFPLGPGYLYYYPADPANTPVITRNQVYSHRGGVAIVYDKDANHTISNGDVLINDPYENLSRNYVFSCPSDSECGHGMKTPEYLWISAYNDIVMIWDADSTGTVSSGDMQLYDLSGDYSSYDNGYVFSCGSETWCGEQSQFEYSDMFFDDLKVYEDGYSSGDFFYSPAEFLQPACSYTEHSPGECETDRDGNLYENLMGDFWTGEAVIKSDGTGEPLPVYKNIAHHLPFLSYTNFGGYDDYNSNEDIIIDADESGLYNADLLQSITISNAGTCASADIDAIKIYQDGATAGWGGDEKLIGMLASGDLFGQIINTASADFFSIDTVNRQVYVVVDVNSGVSEDCTLDVRVEQDSMQLASNNDGPTDAPLTAENIIKVDAKQPTPTVSVAGAPVSLNDLDIDIIITYDELMDQTSTPDVVLNGSGAVWSLSSGSWASADTYTSIYTHDGTAENAGVQAVVGPTSGAKDLAGYNDLGATSDVFAVHTIQPEIVNADLTHLLINESTVGETFMVGIAFGASSMDYGVIPNIEFASDDVITSGTLVFDSSNSGWEYTDEMDTYVFAYTIDDVDEETSITEITFSGAQDIYGNIQLSTLMSALISGFNVDVDTRAPFVAPVNIQVGNASGNNGEFIIGDIPILIWDGGNQGEFDTMSSVIFNASEFLSSADSVAGSATSDNYYTVSLSELNIIEEGNKKITVTVIDDAGNTTGPVTSSWAYVIDTIVPEIVQITTTDRFSQPGIIDSLNLAFSEAVLDVSVNESSADLVVSGESNVYYDTESYSPMNTDPPENDAYGALIFPAPSGQNTGAIPDVTMGNSGFITDLAGNPMLALASGDITEIDGAPPVVMSTVPAHGESNVPISRIVEVEFSEEIPDHAGMIGNLSSDPVVSSWAVLSASGDTVKYLHDDFTEGETYELEITEARDSAGNFLSINVAGHAVNNPWTFRVYSTSGGGGDIPAPSNASIKINDGAASIASTSVTLNLWADYATEMKLSNSADFAEAEWQTFDTSKAWTLTSGAGVKTVYAKFRGSGGVSEAVSDTINLTVATGGGGGGGGGSTIPPVIPPVDDEDETDEQDAGDGSTGQAVPAIPERLNPVNFPGGFQSGDRVKLADSTAVYYLGYDGYRHVYPHYKVYFSWYPNFNGVKIISADDLARIVLDGNITMRPGSYLVKIQTVPNVYAVEPGGVLRWIATQEIARAMYSDLWNDIIKDISPAFFPDYIMGSDITQAVYPTGQLIKYPGKPGVYYMTAGQARLFKSGAVFDANKLQWNHVINVPGGLTFPRAADDVRSAEPMIATAY